MSKGNRWNQLLASGADLASETMPGLPIVEMAGDGRVLIERHGGVTEYSRDRISVKVPFGSICVRGNCMELTRMTRQQLLISGHIDCIELHRRNR